MAALCIDTETTVSDAIERSVGETFSMMIGKDVSLVQRSCLDTKQTLASAAKHLDQIDRQMTVVVGLSGDLQGSVSVCLDLPAALDWTRQLIDHETDTVDQTVVDAIGELGNMVVGGAKGRLSDFQLSLGLPSVLLTGRRHLAFPTHCTPIELQFAYEGWNVYAFVALVRRSG